MADEKKTTEIEDLPEKEMAEGEAEEVKGGHPAGINVCFGDGSVRTISS
jgi:prepilin-type processing-associated H-X9-DG protein